MTVSEDTNAPAIEQSAGPVTATVKGNHEGAEKMMAIARKIKLHKRRAHRRRLRAGNSNG